MIFKIQILYFSFEDCELCEFKSNPVMHICRVALEKDDEPGWTTVCLHM